MKLATILKIIATIALTLAVLPALSLASPITVTGTVTDANGEPVQGANVTLLDDSFNTLGVTTTDTNGNFKFLNEETSGSSLVKPSVTYVRDGHNYSTRLENIQWYDASQGLLKLPVTATRLYDYPPSDYGYAWGVVMDSKTNGKALDATVYLTNGSVTLTTETDDTGVAGSFRIRTLPGTYEIFAVHRSGNYSLVSNRTTITIVPTREIFDAPPITIIADQRIPTENLAGIPTATATLIPPVASPYPTPGTTPTSLPSPSHVPGVGTVKVIPMAAALVIGALMIFGGWALFMRK
jgi:hypothetical protein